MQLTAFDSGQLHATMHQRQRVGSARRPVATRPLIARSLPQRQRALQGRPQLCVVGALPPTKQDKSDGSQAATDEKKKLQLVERAKQRMMKRGVDKTTAVKILREWKKEGIETPEDLRKILVSNSLRSARSLTIQLLLDAGSAAFALYTAGLVRESGALGQFGLPTELVIYFLGCYSALAASVTLLTLGAVASTALNYNANSEQVLVAVRQLAAADGGGGGALVGLGAKGRTAVDTLKVVNALNKIADILKENLAGRQVTTLDLYRDLSAYLTLERAEQKYGFDAAAFGISSAYAADIAACFNEYDLNGDGVLETAEMEALCEATFQPLSREEVEAAMALLDKNESGAIDFHEFVAWWVNKVEMPSSA